MGILTLDRIWPILFVTPLRTFYAALCGLMIVGAASGGLAARLLEQRPLVFIGRISYSLYLWHVPVLVGTQAILRSSPARVGLELPVVVVVAVASYYIVEQPLRRRFASPRGRAAPEVPALQQPLQVPGQRLTRTFAEG